MHKPAFLNKISHLWMIGLFIVVLFVCLGMNYRPRPGQSDKPKITTIYQDFSEDPGWEGINNWVECEEAPLITQDFGWSPSSQPGESPGEIGGTIWRSTIPSYYAMPIGPFDFTHKLTASGKLSAVAPPEEGWGFYIGFFNHYRQGWRAWSSIGFRSAEARNGAARFHLDYKTHEAAGAILNPDVEIPCDGSAHTWRLEYDPDATVGESWPDPRLPGWIGSMTNTHEDKVLERARKDEPDMTKERMEILLKEARDLGLVDDWYRKGKFHLWEIEKDAEKMKGKITFWFDDHKPVSFFLLPGHREAKGNIDRFGVWNTQIYHGSMEFHLTGLKVNGQAIDLSRDPLWDGRNNRMTFRQTDFHSRQNFRYSETNWAGEAPGEIGGRFWGTEVLDPLHGYYADDVGMLTLDDPISFSGSINFVEGAVDGRMLLGYFNKEAKLADIEGEYKGNPPHQYLGIEVMDQTRVGYSFTAVCSPRQDKSFEVRGPTYIPDRIKRPFTFDYDPEAGKAGRITVTLREEKFTADLTKEQRKIGAVFDRFGLLNPRKGGKYVDVYVDDMSYVVRRPDEFKPVHHEQEITVVPYPPDGRLYR